MKTNPDFKTFLSAYLEAALWSSTINDGTEDEPGEWESDPFDKHFAAADFTPEALEILSAHCLSFWSRMYYYIAPEAEKGAAVDVKQAGHDFWLTQNGHGSGFWDGDWPVYGDMLTKLAKCYPEINLAMTEDRSQVCLA